MSKVAGLWSAVYFGGYDLSGLSNQFNVEINYAEDDVTGFQEGAENSIPDMPAGLADLTAFVDPDTDKSVAALATPGGYTDEVLTILFGHNATPAIGDGVFAMTCKQFTYTPRIALRNAVVAACTFRSAGEKPDVNAILLANTTITNTTNFTSVDNGASSANGGAAYLQVMSVLAADTYAVKVQHSTDDNVWVDLGTFTLNGSARGSERIEFSGTVNRYVRAQATRTGSAGNSFDLAVVLARH